MLLNKLQVNNEIRDFFSEKLALNTNACDFIMVYAFKLDLVVLSDILMKYNLTFYASYNFFSLQLAIFKVDSNLVWSDFYTDCLEKNYDCVRLNSSIDIAKKGLLLMDMDSTAIEVECIDELAKLYNIGDKVSAITESAMRGELDFSQSLRARVNLLSGADEHILEQVRLNLPKTSGLETLCKELQQQGWYCAIASGGFTYFADSLKHDLALSDVCANQLEIIDGKLTGKVLGAIVDSQYKADFLIKLCEKYNISPKQSVAIGDGANDIPMLNQAGLGVAFKAKPKVQQLAKININYTNLTAVLAILAANQSIRN